MASDRAKDETKTGAYLAPLLESDGEVLFSWINDRDSVLSGAAYRPVHAAGHASWWRDVQVRNDLAIFAIRSLPGDLLVGTCQLHGIHPVHRSAELQIRIGDKEARSKGYGGQAVRQLLRFGFKDLNLNRIYLHVFATNQAAIRVYEKNGFKAEGVLREHAFVDGRYVDTVLMAVLRSEAGNAATRGINGGS